MKLTGRLVRVANVTDVERDEMYSLMRTFYENVDRSTFESDLEEKHWVILLDDPNRCLVRGFSTQMLLHREVAKRQARVLFSGDTIVHREYWAKNPLAHIWGNFALSLIDDPHEDPLFWFLTTKGYKTYRFLPVFFHEFYPRHDAVTPPWALDLVDALALRRYPHRYVPGSGVLVGCDDGCRLREGVAQVTDKRLQDPHIQFFARSNPQHALGSELCCVAPLTRDNFTPAALRVIGSSASLERVAR